MTNLFLLALLKVLVQFIDPADLSAIVEIDVKAGGADSDLVRAYCAARSRFIAPSLTSD